MFVPVMGVPFVCTEELQQARRHRRERAATAVFFNDGNAANNRDVVIFDGNDSNFASAFDPAGWNATLSGN